MKAFIVTLLILIQNICPGATIEDNATDSDIVVGDIHKVYRIFPNTTHQLEFLKALRNSAVKFRLNFWKDPTTLESFCDIMAPTETQPQFEQMLISNNLNYTVIIEDVRKLIERRENNDQIFNNRIMADSLRRRNKETPYFNFHQYQSYDEIRSFMRSLESSYPTMVKVSTIGYSYEKRPIDMIQIGYPLNSNTKKAIWIDAGIHAREWAAPSTAVFFINELVTKYNLNPLMTQYVQNLTWYIVPVVNPDGYEYSRSSRDPEVRLWRKNRAPNLDKCKGTKCCMGVDLNRNFDFHWGESGASSNPCDEDYEGSYVFSEPESRTVRDFVMEHRNKLDAFITLHTYSQLWIHPYGHKKYNYPSDINDLKATADEAATALKKMYGTKFIVGSGADTLYVASGGSDDWSKEKAGIKYVYLLELRPSESAWDGFILPSSQIIPTGRETWEGVKIVANAVLVKNGFTVVDNKRRRKRKRKS